MCSPFGRHVAPRFFATAYASSVELSGWPVPFYLEVLPFVAQGFIPKPQPAHQPERGRATTCWITSIETEGGWRLGLLPSVNWLLNDYPKPS